MRHRIFLAVLLAMLMAASASAQAQTLGATIIANTDLHAGPGDKYPLLAHMKKGMNVEVSGCLFGGTWCETAAGSEHGWIRGTDLGSLYHGNRVNMQDFGPQLGLGILQFNELDYWSRYYPDRKFYINRYVLHKGVRCESGRDCKSLRIYGDEGRATGYWKNGHYYVNEDGHSDIQLRGVDTHYGYNN